MINKIPELARLELNKQNVMKILFECRATDSGPKTFISPFYDKTSSRKAPPVRFDASKLFAYTNLTSYLLGQLKRIHEHKEHMAPEEGILNYNNEKWTDDYRALFALYYLVTADTIFPKFIDGEKDATTPDLTMFYGGGLKPTYSPSDPNFKLEDARKALKCLGVILPDNL